MGRHGYRRRVSKHYTNSIKTDAGENFVIRKCIVYFQNHIRKFGLLDNEALDFVGWILCDMKPDFLRFIISFTDKSDQEYCENAVYESSYDSYAFSQTVEKTLSKLSPSQYRSIIRRLDQMLDKRSSTLKQNRLSGIEKTAEKLKNMFKLSDAEVELCLFLFINDSYDAARSFFTNHLNIDRFEGRKYLCNSVGITMNELQKIYFGTLVKNDFIRNDRGNLHLTDDFAGFFQSPSSELLPSRFYGKARKSPIPLGYHFVPEEQTEHLLSLLRRKTDVPTHILLYGQPGTGKTSYACGLVNELSIPSYEIAQDQENQSRNRRAAIAAALNLTDNDAVLIVDEADNILNTRFSWLERGETQDKGYLNRMLEEPGTRIIWICNNTHGIEPSLLRRFAFSIEFKPFTRKQRIRIFENVIKKNRVKRMFSNTDIETFARRFDVNAGTIELSIKKAVESGAGDKHDFIQKVEMAIQAYQTLTRGNLLSKDADRIENCYTLEGLNIGADIDAEISLLEKFSAHLQNRKDCRIRNMNLLFYGPPGTGKSELARYIADRLDREIIVKRLSDILSKWVGETEQNIRKAFMEAEREEAVLVIDEADSLLFPRQMANQSWEISQTNEFLTAMERFKGILICTTNMVKGIDSASVRRFNRKIGFDFLTPDGNMVFYNKFLHPLLNHPLTADIITKLRRIKNLAPGDFKNVRDRFSFESPEELSHGLFIDALKNEALMKKDYIHEKNIGF